MPGLRDLDPGWYSESPIVAIEAQIDDKIWLEKSKRCTFYLHKDLLLRKSQSKLFTKLLSEREEDSSAVLCTVECWPAVFQHFIRWLYEGKVDSDRIAQRLDEMWLVACQIESPAFKNYLVDLCYNRIDYFADIQCVGCLVIQKNAGPELLEFLMERLAFTISRIGWKNFNFETDAEWENTMKYLEEDGMKESVVARFQTKLAEAAGLFMAGGEQQLESKSPGKDLCKFHEHISEDDKWYCQSNR